MSAMDWLQIVLYLVTLLVLAKPLGDFIARVYEGKRTFLTPILEPLEHLFYHLAGIKAEREMEWRDYAVAVLLFNLLGALAVYSLQRLQGMLPINPAGLPAVEPLTAFNTAASFATNTNWQGYAGETTLSYLTQMLGLTVQNFVSAASGMAVLAAFVRGFVRHGTRQIGNFWVDLTRSTLYILLPLSLLLALVLAGQGVVQTFDGPVVVHTLDRQTVGNGERVHSQTIARGPVASQEAIKQLGTNGGGFFNTNSAHPFENPTPISNFLEMLAILLIPAALCHTFGRMIGDSRQGWAILVSMTVLFVAMLGLAIWMESAPAPALVKSIGATGAAAVNLEGKEVRVGVANSVLWATATTAASNGSVNSMHDSFLPLGGLVPLWLMELGEVVYGGVGSGLYGMLIFAIIAVFVAGLMVGRTPEYLGKKIEAFEMKMSSLAILVPILLVLLGTAAAVMLPAARDAVANPGPHGFSEILYAFSSAGNNNGSAFAGLDADTPFYDLALAVAMLISRYWLMIFTLAIGGSLAEKKKLPASAGTLPTDGPLFVAWLIAVVVMVGALSFLPALALGPIAEHLLLR
jgi:K+-transporting ATPase ATPase A chain